MSTDPGAAVGREKPRRIRTAKVPVVLKSSDGNFMCDSGFACDVAFMLSRAEGLIAKHPSVDRMQLGELLVDYIDGKLSTEQVRQEIGEWADEMDADDDTDAGRRALAAQDRGGRD